MKKGPSLHCICVCALALLLYSRPHWLPCASICTTLRPEWVAGHRTSALRTHWVAQVSDTEAPADCQHCGHFQCHEPLLLNSFR